MSTQDLEQRARELLVKWRYAEPANGSMASQNRRDAFRRCANELESVLRQQPASVDLEQFREAVEQWKTLAQVGETVEAMPVVFRKKPEEYTARIAEADRLLSIINAGKVECAEPDAWQFLPKGGGDSNWVTVPSPEPWREKGLPVRPLYAHQPALVVDDAMRELIQMAREMVEAVRAIPESELMALDSDPHPPPSLSVAADDLEASLARAQGVQP